MTAPDLDALVALLDKSTLYGRDAIAASIALPVLLAYVRELERERESNWILADRTRLRAERAEAERDALRECVRAADAMREFVPICYASPTDGYAPNAAVATYDAARAKVTLP